MYKNIKVKLLQNTSQNVTSYKYFTRLHDLSCIFTDITKLYSKV